MIKKIAVILFLICIILICIGLIFFYYYQKPEWSEFRGRFYLDRAKSECSTIGMRLPTIEELEFAYESCKSKDLDNCARDWSFLSSSRRDDGKTLELNYGGKLPADPELERKVICHKFTIEDLFLNFFPILSKKEPLLIIDKQCVWNQQGTTLFKENDPNSKFLEILKYNTLLNIVKFEERIISNGQISNFAKVKYENQIGFVSVEDLEWNCEEIQKPSETIEPDFDNLIGTWKMAPNDRLYINFKSNQTFEGLLTGGCDSGGCLDYSITGQWRISRNLIYFRPTEFIPKYPANVKIYYMDKKNVLFPVDFDHGFQYDYNNSDVLEGMTRQR
jgi:hypothetical protein